MTSLLKPAVEYLLRNPPPASHWSAHGFGFLRLRLTKTARMHIWNHQLLDPDDVALIHNHSWTFRSEVVVGGVFNTRYSLVKAGHGTAMDYVEIVDGVVRSSGVRFLEPGKTETFVGSVSMTETSQYPSTYEQTFDEIHHSASWLGTVTVIEREFEAVDRGACVYWPASEPRSVPAPRATTDEEVKAICEDSLRRWF